MTTVLDSVGPTVAPVNARSPDDREIVSLLAKRTYRLTPGSARLEPSDHQLSLRVRPEFEGGDRGLLLADTEFFPHKLLSDVVVQGHAYSYGRAGPVYASITAGARRQTLSVVGDRRCSKAPTGRLTFSEPAPFDRIPLRYDRAYGGHDWAAEALYPNPFTLLAKNLPEDADLDGYSRCAYPRNRHGRGYLLRDTPEAVEGLLLPNLEDPHDPLTPETVLVRDPLAWWRQPLPAGTSWLHYKYFARYVYLGLSPFWRPLDDSLREFERGYVPRHVRDIDPTRGDPAVFGLQNGASLGLQVPHLQPDEIVALTHLHPRAREVRIAVPAAPVMSVRTRWRPAERLAPVLHHIEIHPDDDLVTVVWRGAVNADRALMPHELDALPLRVEWPQ